MSFKKFLIPYLTVLLVFVCAHTMGSSMDSDATTTLAVTSNTDGEDTVSLPDFDDDGTVGTSDFLIFTRVFGSSQGDGRYEVRYDLDADGKIGLSDFFIFIQHFGKQVPSDGDDGGGSSTNPRMVRLIYFLPNDRPYRAEVVQWMKEDICKVQTFFAEQMQAHGYGHKTFRFETDVQGEPLVHRVDGLHPESRYYIITDEGVRIWQHWHFAEVELAVDFYLHQNIYVVYSDKDPANGPDISASRNWKGSGEVDIFREEHYPSWQTLAHELGHTFGLGHDFRDGAYIMSYGGPTQFPDTDDRISACFAEFLSVHPYFNPAIPLGDPSPPTIEWGRYWDFYQDYPPPFPLEDPSPPTIKLLSPTEYPADSRSVSIKFQVSDSDGLHQVLFYASPGFGSAFATGGLRECRALEGEKNAVVEFEYDGAWPAAEPWGRPSSSLTDPLHLIGVSVVDREGNMSKMRFNLTKAGSAKASAENAAAMPLTKVTDVTHRHKIWCLSF